MIEIVTVPVIMALCYVVIEVLKLVFSKSTKFLNFVPLICLLMGIALGLVAFFVAPDIMPANNVISAIFVGAVSGLGATGTNQIVKQLIKMSANGNENMDDTTGLNATTGQNGTTDSNDETETND